MAIWEWALAALVATWLLQSAGTWLQVRHYQGVMAPLRLKWNDGYLGVGAGRASLARGVIVLVVVSPDGRVRECRMMEGRSVLAKFQSVEGVAGQMLETLADHRDFVGRKYRLAALRQAIRQVDAARASAVTLPAPLMNAAA